MRQRDFFNLYANETNRFAFNGQIQPIMNGVIHCRRDKKFRVTISSIPARFYYDPISGEDDIHEGSPGLKFIGLLETIDAERGTLSFFNLSRGRTETFMYDRIELRKTDYTYQELLDKM